MDLFSREDLDTLLAQTQRPCVSILMPTRRGGGEADGVRWRTHLAEAEGRLTAAGLRAPEARTLLRPGHDRLDDVSFWKQQCDGLAFFRAPDLLRLYRLPVVLEDLVVVGHHFHVTPLLPLLRDNGRFYVLALSQHAVRLLQGTRHGVREVDLTGVPRSLAEARLSHEARGPFTFHGRRAGEGTGFGVGTFHGHGVGIDEPKEELRHYFQKIDRGLHPVLRQERAPLALAAVDYLLPLYREANTYPHLLEAGIEGNPDRLSAAELHARAWDLVRPQLEGRQRQAAAQYRHLAGTGRTASELGPVVAAAHRGEVETLFVAPGRRRWGRFDPAGGQVDEHEPPEPGDEELLNLAAVHTLRHGGTVYAVGPEQVPGGGPLAAVFWLPLARRWKRP
jgi:hypothetical protein